MSAFALPIPPTHFSMRLLRPTQRSPTMQARLHPQLRSLAQPPFHLSRRMTRSVSYYAFFKGWLLLSQPPDCFDLPTSFPTEPIFGTLADGLGCCPLDTGR